MRPLVVRGLRHPVNLGQHFLGRHWCSLDFAAGCAQLGVRGQSVQLVGQQTSRAQGTSEGGRPGGAGGPPPLMRESTRGGSPPRVSDPETPRKKGELCPLEAMLMGIGEPESWLMDCSPPPVAWELPLPLEEDTGGELGSLDEAVTDCAEPSPAASSLGSWADECERADAALAAAEAQMG